MKAMEALGTTWTVKHNHVQVFLYVDGRDADSVAWGLKNWPGFNYESSQITPDEFPPEVAPETLLVSVAEDKFDRFVEHVVGMLKGDDVQLYTSAKQALEIANGYLEYETLRQAQALHRKANVSA